MRRAVLGPLQAGVGLLLVACTAAAPTTPATGTARQAPAPTTATRAPTPQPKSLDDRISFSKRVVAAELNGEMAAYPFRELVKAHVANDTLGDRATPIPRLWLWVHGATDDAVSCPDTARDGYLRRLRLGRAASDARPCPTSATTASPPGTPAR